MNPKRQHVGDAKESTSSQGHQGMFERVLLSALTELNLGPSPTVHRKDVRTVVTSLQAQHLRTWHGCVSSLTAVQGLGFG